MKEIFKVRITTLIFILIFSTPIGFYIYKFNSSKINIEVVFDSGRLISTNYCQNYVDVPKKSILDYQKLDQVRKNLINRISGEFPGEQVKLDLGYNDDRGFYKIVVGSYKANTKSIKNLISDAPKLLKELEAKVVNNNFSKFVFHCYGQSYPAFTYVPSEEVELNFIEISAYSRFHILLSAISPFVLFYLFAILFKYIKARLRPLKN